MKKKDQSKALLGVAVWPSRKCDLKRSGPKLTRPLGKLELKSPWPYNFRQYFTIEKMKKYRLFYKFRVLTKTKNLDLEIKVSTL